MNLINSRRNLQPVTVLHTADFHLKGRGPFSISNSACDNPEDETESGFRALQAVVETANRIDVDLVVIPGDLFDIDNPSEPVVWFVQEQFSRLKAPAVLIPGNHDCLSRKGVYLSHNWNDAAMRPKIITAPEGEMLEVPGLPIFVWGRAMTEHTPDFEPLEGLPPRNGSAWQVALAHGFFYADGEFGERSSPIYAEQIRSSEWDYIALGHNHAPREVSQGSVKAAYSGSPVAFLSRKAQALLIEMDGRRSESVCMTSIPIPES